MSPFERPILIYDDKCSSCTRFANYVRELSRGLIYCIGHNSVQGRDLKNKIFQPDYDSTMMFWLIDTKGAHGGHFGLIPVVVHISRGIIRSRREKSFEIEPSVCFIGNSCRGKKNTIKRIWHLIRYGQNLPFGNFYKNY
jgi:hypothetical protein